jgi:hypothetical protein
MNELDYKLRELWCLVMDIEKFDFSNTPKKTDWEVSQLKNMILKKENLIKKIKELNKNSV